MPKNNSTKVSKSNLIINENLSKIIIPREKTRLFIDWYSSDVYKEKVIPQVYNEGYFIVDLSELIKFKHANALETDATKIMVHTILVERCHNIFDKIVIHYRIISDTKLIISAYTESKGECICKDVSFDIEGIAVDRFIANIRNVLLSENKDKPAEVEVYDDLIIDTRVVADNIEHNSAYEYPDTLNIVTKYLNSFSRKLVTTCVYLLISALWYLASSKPEDTEKLQISDYRIKSARYDNSNRNNNHKHKNKVRNITAPIYNFGFVKELDVNKLISKKKGWKISYEFQVRGHYRHYKSGKVVFIKPFEKGKGLEKKQTIIKLNPIF